MSYFLRLLLQELWPLAQVAVNAAHHRGIFMPHQDRHRENVQAAFERPGAPRMPEHVEAALGSVLAGKLVGQLPPGFREQLALRLRPRLSLLGDFLLEPECELLHVLLVCLDAELRHSFLAEGNLQPPESTVHGIRRPGISVGISEQRPFGVEEQQPLRDLQGPGGEDKSGE